MTRTSEARERLLALYRAGAPEEEQLAALAEYDEAAIMEGVRAIADSLLPLSDWQRDRLAVLLAPPLGASRPSRRARRSGRSGTGSGT